MSSLKVNQIKAKLRGMFEAHLNLADIPAHDAERDVKVLSRCLAAFAIYHETGCSEKEAAAAVWDGGGDNGVDAGFHDSSDTRVIFVQAKWIEKGSGEPEAKDIGSFTKGVKQAVELDFEDFHARLHAKLKDLASPLQSPGTRVHMVVVSTGASALDKPAQSRIDLLLEELNGEDPDPIASAVVVGLAEVYSRLASDPKQGSVTLDATILDWNFVSSPFPAYLGMIDGLQLKQWWKQFGKRVVAANIRHALGATEVNSEIHNTAATSPERFWYFNNGITLVAEDAVKAPGGAATRAAGNFSFRGASIVNGAQTISSIAKVDNDGALGNVRVSIRVILLDKAPAGFGGEVTRTNNLQNRVEARDFVVQDPEQKRLRMEMSMEGIDYQVVRTEETTAGLKSCELIEVTTALACASGDSSLAVHLKTGIGRFFADLSKAPYKALFNPSLSGPKAFNAVLVQRHIDHWVETKKASLPKRSGVSWGILVHGNRILAAAAFRKSGLNLSQPIDTFAASLDQPKLNAVCEDVCSKMEQAIQKNYSGAILSVLFKNLTKSKVIFESAST